MKFIADKATSKSGIYRFAKVGRWLGDVAIFRYEHFSEPLNESPRGVKGDDGLLIPMKEIISQHLQDEAHV